jgi:hypothetical protein
MIKAIEIVECKPYYLICKFNNGEVKRLQCETFLQSEPNKIYAEKILNEEVFSTAKIGALGQVYWDNVAEMKDENGVSMVCEYDLSPEFVYGSSVNV